MSDLNHDTVIQGTAAHGLTVKNVALMLLATDRAVQGQIGCKGNACEMMK